MTRAMSCLAALVMSAVLLSEGRQQAPLPVPGSTISTAVKCASDLGRGEKSKRQFCDVLIRGTGPQSVVVPIPAHRGDSVLMFDLHNRFVVPTTTGPVETVFAGHTALVAIVSASGDVLARAVVSREYRTPDDLFDRIVAGAGTQGVKGVAPGYAEAVRVTVPASVSAVGLVGLRLDEATQAGRVTFEAPDRPVAMASNFRLEYVPR